jgi:aspartyl/asparaginyl beta-hydroxylase (cupin superfamily)
MGRPPGKINDTPFQMRASKQFLKSVDKWRARQPDKPSRAEAIRRLVERGLAGSKSAKPHDESSVEGIQMAAHVIDRLLDQSATVDERESRKRKLIKGPKEFRDIRSNPSKAKGRKPEL